MPIPLDATEVLNREFLTIRAKILELAATFDRLDRADGTIASDPRMKQIAQGLAALAEDAPNRAERVQMIFSLPYDQNWQENFSREGWGSDGRAVAKPR